MLPTWVGSKGTSWKADFCTDSCLGGARHPNTLAPCVAFCLLFSTSLLCAPSLVLPPQPSCELQEGRQPALSSSPQGPCRAQPVLAQGWAPCPAKPALRPPSACSFPPAWPLAPQPRCALCRPLISFLINHCWSPAMSFPLQLICLKK